MATIDNAQRIQLEKDCGVLVVDTLLKAGFLVAVDNGGEDTESGYSLEPTADRDAIIAHLRQTDEERIYAIRETPKRKLKKVEGWVYLVYGNCGFDTVSDYTVNLEDTVGKASSEFYDKHEGRLV